MKKAVLVFFVAFVLSFNQVAAAEADGVITGQLINGSLNGEPAGALGLILEAYGAGAVEPVATAAVAGSDGSFEFTGLNTDSSITYYVAAEYLGVTYYSEPINFPTDVVVVEAEVPVYETTELDDAVSIALSHTIISLEEDGLGFTEFFIIENKGDRTYVGSGQVIGTAAVTLVLPLPNDAEHIEIGAEIADTVVFTNAGLVYSGPIKPGYTPATYSYHIHTSQSQYLFSRQVDYTQDRYELLVQGTDKINAPLLTRNETLVIENVAYQYFSGSAISGGEVLSIQLDGLKTNPAQTILWVGGVLVLLVAGFVLLMRRGGRGRVAVNGNEREQLLIQIARLDDEYESGNIEEGEYRTKRAELKNAVLTMSQRPEDEE
ncbi:MAG: hypothetical protein P3T54_09295 [Dehalogenimonas sp.]|uniref:Carboxypeptidase regulatory-like domain-containing protein n=1 Tax=Candidatus Dehalogenimonas loeffleri TaxID=3127115 RepID=A0ABZ2J745_9CHLR|nr:hypothetical protein [Dehalogenimonas sp.]